MSARKGIDPLGFHHPEFDRRQQRWSHNALFGHLRRAEIFTRLVQQRPSTTHRAKDLAYEIEIRLIELHAELKTRIDPPKPKETTR